MTIDITGHQVSLRGSQLRSKGSARPRHHYTLFEGHARVDARRPRGTIARSAHSNSNCTTTARPRRRHGALQNETNVVEANAGQNRLAIATGTDQSTEGGRTNIDDGCRLDSGEYRNCCQRRRQVPDAPAGLIQAGCRDARQQVRAYPGQSCRENRAVCS